MIPDIFDKENTPPGEVALFNKLKNDVNTKNWIILHSYFLPNHVTQTEGEVDFVLIIPREGILCIEVKSHRSVSYKDGVWKMGSKTEKRGPFKQASLGMHSLRNKLIKEHTDYSKVIFYSCVIFTHVTFKTESTEWHDWQVLDSKNMYGKEPISNQLKKILINGKKHMAKNGNMSWVLKRRRPYLEEVKDIANLFRGDFECFEPFDKKMERIENEIIKFSEEQYKYLSLMSNEDRVLFLGPAGTGKTFLALEAIKRYSQQNKRVLFLCFNKHLSEFLKEQTESFCENVTTTSIYSFYLEETGLKASSEDEFWKSVLPSKMFETIIEKNLVGSFDAIVIDEAQDILYGENLMNIDALLKGGLNTGHVRLFGDFENQNIFEKNSIELIDGIKLVAPDLVQACLTTNCRNLYSIGKSAELLGQISPEYDKFLREENDFSPVLHPYTKFKEQTDILKGILRSVLKDGYTLDDIIVLSQSSEGHCKSLKNTDFSYDIQEFKYGSFNNKLRFSTIHAFKGLESPVVILTDMQTTNKKERKLSYVGCSRARDRLYIIHKKNMFSII